MCQCDCEFELRQQRQHLLRPQLFRSYHPTYPAPASAPTAATTTPILPALARSNCLMTAAVAQCSSNCTDRLEQSPGKPREYIQEPEPQIPVTSYQCDCVTGYTPGFYFESEGGNTNSNSEFS